MAISLAGGVRPEKIIEVERRLYHQIIVGKKKLNAVANELHAEVDNDANKLEIEREAIRLRIEQQALSQVTFKAVSNQLTWTVNNAIELDLASPKLMLEQSGIDQKQILLIEQLVKKEPSFKQMQPLIENISWLSRDLVTLMNSPSSKHRRPQSTDVKLKDLKLALNYIGIENLQIFIPSNCFKQWLPSGNANVLWTTRKLWRYSMVTAIAAKALSQLHGLNSSLIYSSALMYQMGTAVILNTSMMQYDKTWGDWLREASKAREKEVYDAVMATEFPASNVLKLILEYGHQLNWQLMTLMDFENSQLTHVLKELDQDYHFNELSVSAATVAKASCYAKVYLLSELNLIEPNEMKVMFDYYQFTEEELAHLKLQNYRNLDLI
ncbi:HDOD domain-containing protein [Shewanella intestini]|uniref:HDOD domain-containing protein n=1 Tax=Shewanella intestini TaxID=2017544 RepID=A0ABS5I100_9GAMM|nr:HDOD domain-containing protein [Shewanella sp. XMDDZSB0408]MBR9727697.1 HDOD domain-containing protein [Shewanella intestini]MRG35153.1 HDOD domain-containing protein [Shewanella sp. XMDDZSB0408]